MVPSILAAGVLLLAGCDLVASYSSGQTPDAAGDTAVRDAGTAESTNPPSARVTIQSHAESADISSFEETFTGTCDPSNLLSVIPGAGIEVLSSSCVDGVLEIVAAFEHVGLTAENRTFTVVNGATLAMTVRVLVSCPDGYSGVAADPVVGTRDFCIAQYEMKKRDSEGIDPEGNDPDGFCGGQPRRWSSTWVPVSTAEGLPWACISLSDARTSCNNLDDGTFDYALITNAQWQAAARNIESVTDNWTPRGVLMQGSNGGDCSSDDDLACYDASGFTDRISDTDSRARHLFSNAEFVWDLTGNAWDLVDFDGQGTPLSPSTSIADRHIELDSAAAREAYDSIGVSETAFLPASDYGTDSLSARGIGKFYVCSGQNLHVMRGGPHDEGTNSGVFMASICMPDGEIHSRVGFRCASDVVLR
jgi:hypothetical protein